jgi:predicted nuclease of predicted toxin-antitoxin system
MPAPAALLDEDVRPKLVATLSERGFDVVSVHRVGPRNVDDALVLERAIALGRVLITHNTDDFRAVHSAFLREGRAHTGVLCLPQRGSLSRRTLRAAMMLDWISAQPHESRFVVWGQLQQLLERGFRLPGYGEDEVREALGWT